MIQRASACAIATLSLLAASVSWADDYVVQIGALESPSERFAEPAQAIGDVRTSRAREGLTRYRVGSFPTKSAAEQALARLRAAGYQDAFVLRTASVPEGAALPAVSAAPPATDELAGLPENLRRRVVYLDGVLHVKEGERFTKLSDYLRSQRR